MDTAKNFYLNGSLTVSSTTDYCNAMQQLLGSTSNEELIELYRNKLVSESEFDHAMRLVSMSGNRSPTFDPLESWYEYRAN
jgi:hypothetical protein